MPCKPHLVSMGLLTRQTSTLQSNITVSFVYQGKQCTSTAVHTKGQRTDPAFLPCSPGLLAAQPMQAAMAHTWCSIPASPTCCRAVQPSVKARGNLGSLHTRRSPFHWANSLFNFSHKCTHFFHKSNTLHPHRHLRAIIQLATANNCVWFLGWFHCYESHRNSKKGILLPLLH